MGYTQSFGDDNGRVDRRALLRGALVQFVGTRKDGTELTLFFCLTFALR
jgi:hypothetical protein